MLRTQLEDAQILRDTKSDYSKKSCQRLSSLRFITSNILELPTMNIDVAAATDSLDQNRLLIEVIHDRWRCSLNHPRHLLRWSEKWKQWWWKFSRTFSKKNKDSIEAISGYIYWIQERISTNKQRILFRIIKKRFEK